jgi:hypothetical protein
LNSIERHTLSYLACRYNGKHYGYDSEQLLRVAQAGGPTVEPEEFTDVLASLVARGLINRTIRWRYYITRAGQDYLSNLTKPNQTFAGSQNRTDAEMNP